MSRRRHERPARAGSRDGALPAHPGAGGLAAASRHAPTPESRASPDADAVRSIAVVADDAAFLRAVVGLLAAAGWTAVPTGSVDAFLQRLGDGRLVCALADLDGPAGRGLDVLAAIRRRGATLPLIVTTARGDVRAAVRAIKAGAFDCLEKPVDEDQLRHVLAEALAESRRVRSRAEESRAFHERLGQLTERERDVLLRMLRGEPNKVIAHELDISPRTVEIHRARVLQKMGVDGASTLIRAAARAEFRDDGASS